MKSFIITIKNNKYSEHRSSLLQKQIKASIFQATTPDNVIEEFNKRNLRYDFKYKMRIETLSLTGSGNLGSLSKASCTMSHFRLYEKCIELGETIMILEHDAVFLSPLTEEIIKDFNESNYGFLKLHHHLSTTEWFTNSQKETKYISNSFSGGGTAAYLIKPSTAKYLVDYALQNKVLQSDDVYIMLIAFDQIGGLKTEITTTSDNAQLNSTSTDYRLGEKEML